MPQARIRWFDDADRFQARFRAGSYEFPGFSRGPFEAGLTQIDFPRLSMQRSDKSAPAAVHSTSHAARVGGRGARRAAVMARFEDFLAARQSGPVYLAEMCAAIGVSERTLRSCCQAHLGMGPIRYLWLRRMALARRALLDADPARATVTEIATGQGFWELGRFAVEYRGLFGETPSTSLRRRPPPRLAPGRFVIAASSAEFA